MFREISIEKYRGLHNITFSELGQINILVGDNNSGKTSILEAIQLFSDKDVLTNMIAIARKREIPLAPFGRNRLQPFDAFLYSFPMYHEQFKEVYIEAESNLYGRCRVGVRGDIYNEDPELMDMTQAEYNRYRSICDENGMIRIFNGEYLYENDQYEKGDFTFRETQLKPEKYHVLAEKQNMPVKKKKNIIYISPMDIYTDKVLTASLYRGMLVEEKNRLLDLMQLFDDRIIGIETAVLYNRPTTMIEMDGMGLMPISVFGDGVKKVLSLASAIIKMRGGIVLIDEFETGIHKRALNSVAQWMISVAERYEVQIFLTTHSSDAIAALIEAQGMDGNMLKAYRLEHYKDKFYVKNFSGSDLSILKNNQGLDIL